jgi:5-methylcytosine-specific restriction endonuclease McrA
MTFFTKNRPLRLDPSRYSDLHLAILKRDGWRCQLCGARTHLEVHHQRFRSQSGSDVEENLIALCHSCHSTVHRA